MNFNLKTHQDRNLYTFKKQIFMFFILSLLLFLSGCGESEELTAFEESMILFHENIIEIGSSIDAIDPSSPDAVESMNNQLSLLQAEFEGLAELEVPTQFSNIETLADDAADYMREAAKLFREAYEEDYVSDPFIQAAVDNYESAMKRLDYISTLLQGELPEGATIIDESENEFEPYSNEMN